MARQLADIAQYISRKNMQFIRTFIPALIFVLCGTSVVMAQTTKPADVQYLLQLKSELALNDLQFNAMDTLFFQTGEQISAIDKEIQNISRSNMPEEERMAQIRDLNAKKKTLRESRDLTVELMLTPQQLAIYKEKIKPAKPSVIHMGMNHDRSQCNVCVPQ
ncbi:MAG TPA: hypothetical protein VIK71_05395 [Flavobacteriales bacterium]